MRSSAVHAVLALFLTLGLLGCETGVSPEEVAELYYNLGNAYFELDEFNNAVTAYLNALELDDSLPQAGYNLARVYIESGDVEKGVEALNQLLEEDPENSVILSTIGWAYYLQNDYEKSYDVFERILERTPSNVNGLYNAAVLAWQLDKKEVSLGYYERLYAENRDAETLYRIASIYLDLERWQYVIDTLDEYLALKPDDADAYYDLGIAYTADRLYGEALAAFDRAVELDDGNPTLYFEKALILLLYIENLDEGLKYLQFAIDAGFADSEKAEALVSAESLLYTDEVREFLVDKGLIAQDTPEKDDARADLGADADTSTDADTGEEPATTAPDVVSEQAAVPDAKSGLIGPKTQLAPSPDEESVDTAEE